MKINELMLEGGNKNGLERRGWLLSGKLGKLDGNGKAPCSIRTASSSGRFSMLMLLLQTVSADLPS